jgi:hypothetical protein
MHPHPVKQPNRKASGAIDKLNGSSATGYRAGL